MLGPEEEGVTIDLYFVNRCYISRLWEKKKDLIKALVRCIGVERALFLYNKTELLELNGGLMTLQVLQLFDVTCSSSSSYSVFIRCCPLRILFYCQRD